MSSIASAADNYIWIEGEAATSKTVQPHNWYSNAIKKKQLSEGGWISNFTDKADGVASYSLSVQAAGEYTLWVRANVIGAALSFQIDDGKAFEIDTSKPVDVINIANDGKPDLRIIGWLNGGNIPLKAGKTSITFTMHSANNHHGGIDSSMEYGTIHVISLDDQSLSKSSKILIQAFSEEKMYGFRDENGTIKDVGRAPINVRDIHGTVTFSNATGLHVTTLNPNGYETDNAATIKNGTVTLPRTAMYTIVTR